MGARTQHTLMGDESRLTGSSSRALYSGCHWYLKLKFLPCNACELRCDDPHARRIFTYILLISVSPLYLSSPLSRWSHHSNSIL